MNLNILKIRLKMYDIYYYTSTRCLAANSTTASLVAQAGKL